MEADGNDGSDQTLQDAPALSPARRAASRLVARGHRARRGFLRCCPQKQRWLEFASLKSWVWGPGTGRLRREGPRKLLLQGGVPGRPSVDILFSYCGSKSWVVPAHGPESGRLTPDPREPPSCLRLATGRWAGGRGVAEQAGRAAGSICGVPAPDPFPGLFRWVFVCTWSARGLSPAFW